MAEKQNTPAADSKEAIAGDPTKYGKRVPEVAERPPEPSGSAPQPAPLAAAGEQADAGVRAAAAAAEESLRTGRDALRTSAQTGQDAMRSSVEAGQRLMEDFGKAFTRSFGIATPNPEAAQQSARNVQAVSQATMALTRGAQEASRTWLDLAQEGARRNVEAISAFAACRTVHDVLALQSNLARENLQRIIASSLTITRASGQAIEEAERAIRSIDPGAPASR